MKLCHGIREQFDSGRVPVDLLERLAFDELRCKNVVSRLPAKEWARLVMQEPGHGQVLVLPQPESIARIPPDVRVVMQVNDRVGVPFALHDVDEGITPSLGRCNFEGGIAQLQNAPEGLLGILGGKRPGPFSQSLCLAGLRGRDDHACLCHLKGRNQGRVWNAAGCRGTVRVEPFLMVRSGSFGATVF